MWVTINCCRWRLCLSSCALMIIYDDVMFSVSLYNICLCVVCRRAMEMHWLWRYGWPTHPSYFTSSAVTLISQRWALRHRTCWPSVCSVHSWCSLTLYRTGFIRRCRRSSVQTPTSTILQVDTVIDVAITSTQFTFLRPMTHTPLTGAISWLHFPAPVYCTGFSSRVCLELKFLAPKMNMAEN